MDAQDPKPTAYEVKFAEYQDAMHAGAWRIGWGFFTVMVGLLPMMWLFVWMVGAQAWEHTLFHAPALMWLGVALNLGLVVFLVFRLYKKNLELDAVKRRYLAELRTLKGLAVERPRHADLADRDAFRDDFQHN
ncbi:MAG TPA: hypothetical protein VNV60_11455 [Holophagaceae bacterium]|jgi:hypothetical protein|nr:hypothetical protein [Holophagaceae bacterium]